MFSYLNSRILSYNTSNLNNMVLLTYFMNVDRHILTGTLALDSLTEFAESFFDEAQYKKYDKQISEAVFTNSSISFLLEQLDRSTSDMNKDLQSIESTFQEKIDVHDADNVVLLLNDLRPYSPLNRHSDNKEQLTVTNIPWWA